MNVPPAILCIGRNYVDHVHEMHGKIPTTPVLFMKNPASIIECGAPIIIPSCCSDVNQVDYEGELAIRISKNCKQVNETDALTFIDGVAAANDVTARLRQKVDSGGQWCWGKSFDTFCPISTFAPFSTIDNIQNLSLTTTLNGEIVQQANTSQMIFSVATLIAQLSQDMTILAGTIILTGTPSGVGDSRTPPYYLQERDVISVCIEGIAEVTNTVQTL